MLYGYSYFNNVIIQEVSACGLRPHFHLDMLSVIRAFRFRKWFQIPKRCHTGVDRKWHKKIKKEHQRMHRRRDKGSTSAQNLEEANYKGDKSCTRALLRAHWSPMGSNSIETQTVLDPSKSGPDPIPCYMLLMLLIMLLIYVTYHAKYQTYAAILINASFFYWS